MGGVRDAEPGAVFSYLNLSDSNFSPTTPLVAGEYTAAMKKITILTIRKLDKIIIFAAGVAEADFAVQLQLFHKRDDGIFTFERSHARKLLSVIPST